MESMTSPIIKVYLTDAQFQELKQDLLDAFSIDLVNNLIDERIRQEQAPYLKQKRFCQVDRRKCSNSKRAKG